MIRQGIYGLILCLVLGLTQARAQWEQVRYRGNMYVTLDSFCDFYSFKPVGREGEKTTLYSGPHGTLKLTQDGRETYINGRKVWLALNLTTNEAGRKLISYVDVVKTMEPILRPQKLKRIRPIRGVVIDAGHGGSDNGARGRYGLNEKTMTLDTSQRLERILKAAGIPTVMTRRTDVFIPLEKRAAIAAQYPNYLFVSVHYNQGQSKANGVETFALTPQYSPSTDSAGVMRVSDATRENGNRNDEANILLTDFIHQEIRKLHSPAGDRGVKRARFVVLRLNSLPATLVEGGFLSNPGDAKLIGSESYREKLAHGIAKGVRRFIALSKGSSTVEEDLPEPETKELTRPPVPEPPRPLETKPPAETPKPEAPKTPSPAPVKPPTKPAAKPMEPVKPAESTPAKAPVKTPAAPTTAKPKTPEKPAPKTETPAPVENKATPDDIPQLKAAEPTTTEVIVPTPTPPPAPRPLNTPMIETTPPPMPKKPSGPMIETSPPPRPAPAVLPTPVPAPIATSDASNL